MEHLNVSKIIKERSDLYIQDFDLSGVISEGSFKIFTLYLSKKSYLPV